MNLEVEFFDLKLMDNGREVTNMAGKKSKEVEENAEVAVIEITEELLRKKLYEVRGTKVMLDFDLAEIYG